MIRYAIEDDIPELSRLHNESIRNTYQGIYSNKYFEELSDFERQKLLKKKMSLEPCRILVDTTETGIITGFALFWFQDYYLRKGHFDNLHVKKEYKQQGIGLNLLKKSAEVMIQNGIEEMFLFCEEKNVNARRFYDHIGFELCGYEWEELGGDLYPNCKLKINNAKLVQNVEKNNDENELMNVIKNDFCLYGAGIFGQVFFDLFGGRYIPKYIFDTNPQKIGQSINGIPIVMPQCVKVPVVVTSICFSEIRDTLMELGVSEIIPFHPWIFK